MFVERRAICSPATYAGKEFARGVWEIKEFAWVVGGGDFLNK